MSAMPAAPAPLATIAPTLLRHAGDAVRSIGAWVAKQTRRIAP
jgi:hypothetical protein